MTNTDTTDTDTVQPMQFKEAVDGLKALGVVVQDFDWDWNNQDESDEYGPELQIELRQGLDETFCVIIARVSDEGAVAFAQDSSPDRRLDWSAWTTLTEEEQEQAEEFLFTIYNGFIAASLNSVRQAWDDGLKRIKRAAALEPTDDRTQAGLGALASAVHGEVVRGVILIGHVVDPARAADLFGEADEVRYPEWTERDPNTGEVPG
jgi:hypothetical protein